MELERIEDMSWRIRRNAAIEEAGGMNVIDEIKAQRCLCHLERMRENRSAKKVYLRRSSGRRLKSGTTLIARGVRWKLTWFNFKPSSFSIPCPYPSFQRLRSTSFGLVSYRNSSVNVGSRYTMQMSLYIFFCVQNNMGYVKTHYFCRRNTKIEIKTTIKQVTSNKKRKWKCCTLLMAK